MCRVGIARLCSLCCSLRRRAEAGAYTAYVSNEKSNTVSVIDTNKWEVVKTIKVGQRPRGIAHTKDQKYVLVAVGDDDTIQIIDTGTNRVVGTCRRAQTPSCLSRTRRQDALRRQRGRQHRDDHRYPERALVGEIQVGVEPEGMGISPDGKVLVNTSETTNMAHFIDTRDAQDRRQCSCRCAAAVRDLQAGRFGAVGVLGGRRNRQRHRSGQARRQAKDRIQDHRHAAASRSSRSASILPAMAKPVSWRLDLPTT